jgi:heme-degrading monooxygenase HmoA
MTFIQQFEAELTQKLENGTDNTLAIVRWASERVLESYKNGIAAGQKGATVKRQGKNSQPVPPPAQ